MRIIMMGTGGYAVPTFRALCESPHEVVALFTRPEAPTRSRRKLPPNPMRDLDSQLGVPIFAPPSVNSSDAHDVLRSLQPELLIVCDYGQILSAETLSLARHGGFNLHASLLPKYRGAAPINWALYHGETETGNTVIHMTPRLDAGPCVAQQRVAIDPDETAVDLEARLAATGSELVLKAVNALDSENLQEIPQDNTAATRAPKLKKSDGRIDWNRTASQIHNQIRAMQPWPKTFTDWLPPDHAPLRLILHKACVASSDHDDEPGTVLEASIDHLLVATGQQALAIQQLQPAGKRLMTVVDFLHGYHVHPGHRLGHAC